MPETVLLGEFEQMVLLAVLQADQTDSRAYGTTVFEELMARTGRRVARGAVYMTLDRLEKKGLLSSYVMASTPERGGRAKRGYRVTRPGLVALKTSHRALVRLWEGLESFS
jgi:PadR family transcriptional regulator, regulatory protein PadR